MIYSAVAWFATIPNRRNSAIAMKYLLPLVEKRMEDMNRKKADPNYAFEEPVCHDLMIS